MVTTALRSADALSAVLGCWSQVQIGSLRLFSERSPITYWPKGFFCFNSRRLLRV